MICQRRMSLIVLILLWTFCSCGTGIENEGYSFTITNLSYTSPLSDSITDSTISKQVSKVGSSTTTFIPNTTPAVVVGNNIKTTSRSKLWSPYSTLVNFMDDDDDEDVATTHQSSIQKSTALGESKSESVGYGNRENKIGADKDLEGESKLPVISSIRHYRSRKSFVRTRKNPINNKLQSELIVKASHVDVTDVDQVQGDQPYYHPISTTTTSTTKYTSGTKAFNYGKVVERKANSKGQNSGISSKESDMTGVYGRTYFTPTTNKDGNSSTKLLKIDKTFLLKKRVKYNNTFSITNDSSAISQTFGEQSDKLLKSKEDSFGFPVLRPLPSTPTKDNLEDGSEDDGGSKYYIRDNDKSGTNLSPENSTKKPKGKGGGKKPRRKGGTKKPKLEDLIKSSEIGSTGSSGQSENFKDVHPTESSSSYNTLSSANMVERKRTGTDLPHRAFRKVKEKQRMASRHPEIRGKSDYKANYNSDAHGDDNDHPSQLREVSPQTREMHASTTSDMYSYSDSSSNADGGDDRLLPIDYFPKAETYQNFSSSDKISNSSVFQGNSFLETDVSRTPSNPDSDEYESLDSSNSDSQSENPKPAMDIVTVFLKIVESQHLLGENCSRGTDFNLGEGVVDRYAQERFRLQAELTVNRANMLTRFWKYADKRTLDDEYILHAMVISLVEFDEDIFAGGNCYDEYQYKNYGLFCPFGYREKDGSILVKDLSLEYPYLSNTSEWFYKARKNAERIIKNYNQFSRGSHSFRSNESNLVEDEILNVTYEDGKWSKPYFDCGGGNIWMITYTIPFFGYNGTYYFKGTSGIDIDLRRVDIDQCPLPENSTELNIFAASDKCKNDTTKCVPIKGLGFRRGSYKCECKTGFYFPNVSSPFKYFNGTLLEEEYEKKFTGVSGNETSLYDSEGYFECLQCPFGCDICVDDRPCVVSLNWLMRTAILILQCAIIAMLPIVGLFTWKYSEVKVVRAASPVLLRFIVLGAFFIYCTTLVMYPSPNVITCTLRVWLREIGFSLAYGALMLKTWRISVIFRVRSAKAIKISDLDLMKRLGIIVGVFTSLLVIRTLVAPPVAIVSYTADELKAWLCKSDYWDHSFTFLELSFLVWGIRLCIVVRKAPSEFNESKFISLAIYNEFLLSLFLNISMLFLQSPANPDLLYIIFFCHVQLTISLLLCLIFGSKAYIVFRGQGKGGSDELRVPTSKFISKSRSGQTTKQISAHNSTGLHSSTTSTSHDPNLNSRLSEDVQEEFRRLYFQLEELKERNMRLGNRHLVAKIAAMQEAADNILCTSAQINGQQQTHQGGSGSSPNVKEKSGGVLSDISEEENPTQLQTLQTPKSKEATGIASDKKVSSTSSTITKHEYSGDNRSILKPEGDGQLEKQDGPTKERREKQESDLEKDFTKEKTRIIGVGVGSGGESSLGEPDEVKKLELQDTNLDDEDFDQAEEEKGRVTFDLSDEGSDIKPDCINEDESAQVENIPMKTIKKRKQHHQRSGKPGTSSTTQASQSGLSSSEVGKEEKSQNHNSSTSKIVLDLDDKSRFTEEITV